MIAVARYLRREDPYSPAPYLMLRGLRWGELRATATSIDPALLAAPPTEVRQETQAAGERRRLGRGAGSGGDGHGRALRARLAGPAALRVAAPATNWAATTTRSHSAVQARSCGRCWPICPSLAEMTLADDTPTANAETLAWINGSR